jgi:hypothetical protein
MSMIPFQLHVRRCEVCRQWSRLPCATRATSCSSALRRCSRGRADRAKATEVLQESNLFADRSSWTKRGNPNMRRGAPSINPAVGPGRSRSHRRDGESVQRSRHRRRRPHLHAAPHAPGQRDREAIDLRRGNWLAKRIVERSTRCCFVAATRSSFRTRSIRGVMSRLEELVHQREAKSRPGRWRTPSAARRCSPSSTARSATSTSRSTSTTPAHPRSVAIHLLEPRELQPSRAGTTTSRPEVSPAERVSCLQRSRAVAARSRLAQASSTRARLAIFPARRRSRAEHQPGQRLGLGRRQAQPRCST